MYVDLIFLFLIYSFATIALAVSVYALWTLEEVKEEFRKKNKNKPKSSYANKPPIQVPRSKGHWD